MCVDKVHSFFKCSATQLITIILKPEFQLQLQFQLETGHTFLFILFYFFARIKETMFDLADRQGGGHICFPFVRVE